MKRLRLKSSKLSQNESGLIPLLLCVLAIVVALIVIAYLRVQHAQQ